MRKYKQKYIAIVICTLIFFICSFNNINGESKIKISGEEHVQIPVVGETIASYKLIGSKGKKDKVTSKVTYEVEGNPKGISIDKNGTLTITQEAEPGEITIKGKIKNKSYGKINVFLSHSWIYDYEKKENINIRLTSPHKVAQVLNEGQISAIKKITLVIRVILVVIFTLLIWYILFNKKRYKVKLWDKFKEENEVD